MVIAVIVLIPLIAWIGLEGFSRGRWSGSGLFVSRLRSGGSGLTERNRVHRVLGRVRVFTP